MEIFLISKKKWVFLFFFVFPLQLVAEFKTGADRLCSVPGKYLKGKRVGVLCHRASIVVRGRGDQEHLVDALHRLSSRKGLNFSIAALFAPEHGFDGSAEAFAHVEHATHPKIGCPIFSLHHGKSRKPAPDMLKGIDLVIIDLQEVGVRCYTYISTMINMLEAAGMAKIPVLLLDRPNVIKSWGPAGDGVAIQQSSFLAKADIPFIHGMTLGEIAKKHAKNLKCKLGVIATQGNQAEAMRYLRRYFVPPSPNLPKLLSQLCYPMTVLIETTNYSEGRGTDSPFELFGAPWVLGEDLAKRLNSKKLLGVTFEAVSFTPQPNQGDAKPKHNGKLCGGVQLKITDRNVVKPLAVAHEILVALFELYPSQSKWAPTALFGRAIDQVMAGPAWRESIEGRIKGRVVNVASNAAGANLVGQGVHVR